MKHLKKVIFISSSLLIVILNHSLATCLEENEDSLTVQQEDGTIRKYPRIRNKLFSIIIPLEGDIITKTFIDNPKKFLIPVFFKDKYFKMFFKIHLLNKEENILFKDFITNDIKNDDDVKTIPGIDKNYEISWNWNKFFQIQKKELNLSNAIEAHCIIGYLPDSLPIKTYILRSYFLNSDNKQILRITAYIVVEPDSKYYNDANEINLYMRDVYGYSKSIKFE